MIVGANGDGNTPYEQRREALRAEARELTLQLHRAGFDADSVDLIQFDTLVPSMPIHFGRMFEHFLAGKNFWTPSSISKYIAHLKGIINKEFGDS